MKKFVGFVVVSAMSILGAGCSSTPDLCTEAQTLVQNSAACSAPVPDGGTAFTLAECQQAVTVCTDSDKTAVTNFLECANKAGACVIQPDGGTGTWGLSLTACEGADLTALIYLDGGSSPCLGSFGGNL